MLESENTNLEFKPWHFIYKIESYCPKICTFPESDTLDSKCGHIILHLVLMLSLTLLLVTDPWNSITDCIFGWKKKHTKILDSVSSLYRKQEHQVTKMDASCIFEQSPTCQT